MRKLENWIGGFLDFSAGKKSPHIYRLWAGIAAISGALQRRVFTELNERDLYPNMYILLVGDPATGKSMAIRAARELIRDESRIHISPQRITKEAFYDELEAASYNIIENYQAKTSHSLCGMIDEFGVFVRRGDLEFMADLTDLYDAPDPFEYITRHQGKIRIPRTAFSFVSACTPQWLRESFTEIALEQGFPSRIIAVHSDEVIIPNLFKKRERQLIKDDLAIALHEDLNEILNLEGEFTWDDDAMARFQGWVNDGMKPYPPDPRLKHYCGRRDIHIGKLAMIVSAARRSTMTVTLDDFLAAQRILLETEMTMHQAYSGISRNPYFSAVESVVKLVQIEFGRSGRKPIAEHKIVHALQREVPFQWVTQIIDQLIASRRLIAEGTPPHRGFIPGRITSDDEIGGIGHGPQGDGGS